MSSCRSVAMRVRTRSSATARATRSLWTAMTIAAPIGCHEQKKPRLLPKRSQHDEGEARRPIADLPVGRDRAHQEAKRPRGEVGVVDRPAGRRFAPAAAGPLELVLIAKVSTRTKRDSPELDPGAVPVVGEPDLRNLSRAQLRDGVGIPRDPHPVDEDGWRWRTTVLGGYESREPAQGPEPKATAQRSRWATFTIAVRKTVGRGELVNSAGSGIEPVEAPVRSEKDDRRPRSSSVIAETRLLDRPCSVVYVCELGIAGDAGSSIRATPPRLVPIHSLPARSR